MTNPSGELRIQDRHVQPALNRILGPDAEHQVEPRIMAVLLCLAERPGEVVAKDELIARVWDDVHVSDDVLVRAVGELRRIFGDDSAHPRVIETIRKRGYRLLAPVEAAAPARPAGPAALDWRRLFLVPLAVAVVAVGGAALLARQVLSGIASAPPVQFVTLTSSGSAFDPAVSPDGTRVAYAQAEADGASDLWIKLIVAGPALRLTAGPEQDVEPAWSPDGTRIAFTRIGAGRCDVFLVPSLGGPERRLAPCGDTGHHSLAWSPDGRRLAHTRRDPEGRRGVALLDVETLAVRSVTFPRDGHSDEWPAFSPDGRLLAFVRYLSDGVADLYRVDLAGGEPVRLTRDHADIIGVSWAAGGLRLVFCSNRAGLYGLWSLPASGGAAVLLAGGGSRLKHPSSAARGDVIAYEDWDYEIRLWRTPLEGSGEPEVVIAGPDEWNYEPALSPDGTRLAFGSTRSGSWELWLASSDGSGARRLTDFGGPLVGQPAWSPDGSRLAAVARPQGTADVYVIELDGSARRLTSDPADDIAPSWSQDGRSLLFASRRGGRWNVWRVPAAGGEPSPETGDGGLVARESPDASWLYFTRPDRRGLWRRPTAGGAEQRVLAELLPERAQDWALTSTALFFKGDVREQAWLLRAEPDGSEALPVVSLRDQAWSGLAVSGDGRWLYSPRTERRSSRIVVLRR